MELGNFLGGGGLNIFFSGPKRPPRILFGLVCLRGESVGLFGSGFPLSGNWVWSSLLTVPPVWKLALLGRAIHGPIPVSGETFGKFSAPLVHTDFPENKAPTGSIQIVPEKRHQGIGPYRFPLKFIWTNGSQISVKVLV